MTTQLTDAPVSTAALSTADPSPGQIIAAARRTQTAHGDRSGGRGALLLGLLSSLLLWASFPPLEWSPLAWLAPVPLLLLVRIHQPVRRQSLVLYLAGLAFFLPALQWLRLGDPTMYLAWWALACYLACMFPVFVGLTRAAVFHYHVPLVIAAPIVWVALEYVRAHLFTGFAWYLLGHTQYRWLEIIQISDLVGGYGVSAVMIAAASAVSLCVPSSWFLRLRLLGRSPVEAPLQQPAECRVLWSHPAWVGVGLGIVVLAWGYGQVRRGQAEFTPGPRVALIQGNFVASLRIPPEDFGLQYTTHMRLTARAVREQPDIIVWPESMFRWPLTSAPAGLSDDELQDLAPRVPASFWRDTSIRKTLVQEAQKTGAAMIYGMECVELTPQGQILQANSAVMVRPESGFSGRYDKMHLVPFGEYLPLKSTLPWLQKLTPYPPDFGLTAGESAQVFEHGPWRMLPVICFEDTVPHLVRGMVLKNRKDGRDVDLLVNLSNDGWFHGSSGLDQHLITAAFRAVETRTPLVRAVNTGISAIIDGDGAIREPDVFFDGDKKERTTLRDPKSGRWYRQLNAAQVSTVPLDPRSSLYVACGDWAAMLCLGLTLFVALGSLVPIRRTTTAAS